MFRRDLRRKDGASEHDLCLRRLKVERGKPKMVVSGSELIGNAVLS
ncbi:hypothetical protein [Bradyrhizobium sp. 144]|nr:hypothetical protein [Bradyrhizobium sp. 144]MCK1692454.1 hypothetical protein [Bradyrhizobium sp. 144]